MFRAILLIALVPAIFATEGILSCADWAYPVSVTVVGCDAQPCEMKRGEERTTIIEFVAKTNITSFEPRVHAKIAGILDVNYDLPEAVRIGCDWLQEGGDTKECPIEEGQSVVYHLIQAVDPESPTLFSPVLTFKFFAQDETELFCYTWTAKIV